MTRKKIIAVSGSTRTHSTNEALLNMIARKYSDRLDVRLYTGIVLLPHFNPDVEGEQTPATVVEWRDLIENADGVIICTPEYVFSLPGALKNAIEWTVSTTVFQDKPLAFIVASGLGEKTFESLTLIMKTVGASIGEHSRLLIQGSRGKVSNNGHIKDEGIVAAIDKLINSFVESIPDANRRKP